MPDKLAAAGAVEAAKYLLREHHVLAMPGTLFGSEYNEHLRFAAVQNEETLREVLCRLGAGTDAKDAAAL
jgi:aspartate/methionine/tyrosine aminotransferase